MSKTKTSEISKTLVSASGIVIMLAVVILVNVIFSHASLRWDLTEDKTYSLSDGTKNILENLQEDVTIKVFYNKSLPDIPIHIKTYARRILEFLNEYVQYGKGKISLEIYDPRVDSDEEEWAMKYGIQALNLPAGDKIYFGLVVMAVDQEETIPFIDPAKEALFEYDITRMIYRVQNPSKKVVGIISSHPVFGSPQIPGQPQANSEPWMFITEMKKTYNVREISTLSESIDKDVDLLLIIHPKQLSEKLQYAIDQYVLLGKNAIVFVDPVSISDTSPARNQYMRNNSSSIDRLFTAWGITLEKNKAVVDMHHATKLRTQNNKVESNPIWISANKETFSSDNVITANLDSLLFPVAGSIKKAADGLYEVEPLIQSSLQAALTDSFKANFGAENIRRDFSPSAEKLNIAVKVQGKFKTAFPAGPPKDDNDKENSSKKQEDGLKEAKDNVTIIAVADTDMLFDSYYVQKQNFFGFNMSNMFNDNLNFLLNSAEVLTGSQDLISIRSRGKFERPFTTVQKLERKAQERWHSKEQELVKQVEATNSRLRTLEQKKDPSQKMIISPEQEAEMKKFQDQKIKIGKELKHVRRNLRADIEALGTKIKFINIFLMPLLVSIGGILFAVFKQKRANR
ncbi:ABC transporter [Candidatus Magnetomoraceae bacterium gMMP-15]